MVGKSFAVVERLNKVGVDIDISTPPFAYKNNENLRTQNLVVHLRRHPDAW